MSLSKEAANRRPSFGQETNTPMQHHPKRDVERPTAIRGLVWLFCGGVVLLCLLLGRRHHTEQHGSRAQSDEAREEIGVAHTSPEARKRSSFRREYRDETEDVSAEIDLSMVDQVTQDRKTWIDDARDALR